MTRNLELLGSSPASVNVLGFILFSIILDIYLAIVSIVKFDVLDFGWFLSWHLTWHYTYTLRPFLK